MVVVFLINFYFSNCKFIPLHLDFDQDARVAKVLEVERLPCTVIINADADLLQKREGYLDCNQYLRTLESALEKSNQIQQLHENFLNVFL